MKRKNKIEKGKEKIGIIWYVIWNGVPLLMYMLINDYITQGYRCYLLKDLPIKNLASSLPSLCRRNRLEYLILGNIIYIKNTNKYDQPRNPYV
jgi:hypothetical protein